MTLSSSEERRSTAQLVLGVLGLLGLLGGGTLLVLARRIDCTELARWPTLSVGFREPLAEPGRYRLKVRADGVDLSCDFDVPLPKYGERSCRGLSVGGARNGPAGGIGFDGVHRFLTVVVERDDTVVRWGAFEPVYRDIEVNGPGCGVQPIGDPVVLSLPGG